jgi:hypothetical protein
MDTTNTPTTPTVINVKVSGLVGTVIIAGASILAYKTVCRMGGFRMVRPDSFDENFFYVVTRSGKVLKCAKDNLTTH